MAPMKKLIETVYLPGRPVCIKPSGTRPPGVPQERTVEGIILKAIMMPNWMLKVYVETDGSCAVPPQLYERDRIELLEVDQKILRKNLSGRRAHFPRSSGIGIDFPDGASDHGDILGVNYSKGCPDERCLTISVGIEVKDHKGIWVTIADFTQCDLVPCRGAGNE